MFGPRGATSLKMHRGKLINVMIGLAEPMRERVTQSSTFLWAKEWKNHNVVWKSFEAASRLYPLEWSYLEWKALEVPEKVANWFLIANNGSG
jgi:hypothetical protein